MSETPVPRYVQQIHENGRNIYIDGWSDDGSLALIVDADNGEVSVAPANAHASLGRWECSLAHLRTYPDIYRSRFPNKS